MVLERYSDEIISAVTSPLTGVQRKCKQPPSLADVVNACDEESARIERLKRLNSMRFEAHTDPRPKHHRANVFVHSNAPQYARMLARAENGADPNDFCYDATRPGIWVPIGWLTEQGPAARRGFKQFTKEDLEKIYKRHDEAKRAASNPPIAAEINQRK